MPNQSAALRELARQVTSLDRRVRAIGSGGQLGNSSFENGAISGYSGDSLVMQVGLQWDGTYAPIVTNGPTPPTPSAPIVTDATQGLVVEWDGSFAGGLIPAPMDFARVDVHVGALSDFIPDHDNRRASFVAPQGGQASITLPDGTWYVKLVCWTLAGKVSSPSDVTTGVALPPAAGGTDGNAPASSPAAEVVGGYEALAIRWTPIVNADPVTYQVHVSTTSGFTPDSSTMAASGIAGGAFTLRLLPGSPPADPSDADTRKLQYDTVYYVRIVAEDGDGEAAPGVQGFDSIFKITGGAIGAETIVGGNILGGTITADLLSSTLVLSSEIWTSLTGQRVGLTPDGYFAYKADNSLMFKLPTDGTDALYDGELIVRGATVTGGMSIQSDENELTSDAALTLMRGIAPPQASPQFADNYEKIAISTAGLTTAQKTGDLGTFDLVPSEVAYLEYNTIGPYWVLHQHRTAGTRSWYFTVGGAPLMLSGVYFTDSRDYLIVATTSMSTSTSTKNGGYTLFQYIPDSYNYWLSSPSGVDRYSRQNGSAWPTMGNNGTDIYVAEVNPATSGLTIRYYVPPGQGVNLPAPIATHTTTTGYTPSVALVTCHFSAGGFDRGSPRYFTAERGVATNGRLLSQSGTVWYPGGSGNNWASATKEAESFEAATTNRRGAHFDGSNFWSFHADGYLYKHTSEVWDSGAGPSKVWSRLTFRDTDAGGTGLHETLPGAFKTFTRKRRSRWSITLPSPPDNGGVDDPNETAVYCGVGTAQPANTAMYRQFSGLGSVNITTLNTTNPNPPTTGTFPNANPAIVRSDDDALQIKGDATIKAIDVTSTTVKATSSVVSPIVKVGADLATGMDAATNGPYWLGYLSSNPTVPAVATTTPITTWTAIESNGVTLASGVFTIPKAGLYRVTGQLWWASGTLANGTRLTQARRTGAVATTIASVTLDSKTAGAPALAQWSKLFRFAAGDTMVIQFNYSLANSAGTPSAETRVPTGTSQDISFFQIIWDQP